MRRQVIFAAAFLSLTLAACGTDSIEPKNGQPSGKGLQPGPVALSAGQTCDPSYDADSVTADLNILMSVLTPNNNSAQSKWQYVQLLMSYNNPDSTAKAQAYAQSPLISFIQLKYSQEPSTVQNSTITDSQGNTVTITQLLNKVVAGITCFVSFDIPTSNDPVVKVLPDGKGGVWFPPGFCDASCGGINVTLEEIPRCTDPNIPNVPAGCISNGLNTLLDQYGFYLKITLTGGTPNTTNPAIVALCVPSGTDLNVALRLQVGHQETNDPSPAGFSVLDKPQTGIPTELSTLLTCDEIGASNHPRETTPKTMLARFVSRVADLLLPEKAQARMYYFGGLGVGGTTKTFSPFSLTDPTLSATGGIGGSKGSFSPAQLGAATTAPSSKGAPAKGPSLTTKLDGNLQDSIQVIQTTNLPTVLVKTKTGTPIPGATVTWKTLAPVTDPYKNTVSNASVCSSGVDQTSVTTTTNSDGLAQLDCLDYGDALGYKDLAAIVDPRTAPGLSDAGGISNVVIAACDSPSGLNNLSSCGTAAALDTLNWLVTTVTGPASKLTLPTAPGAAPQLGKLLSPQPVGKVTDAQDHPVSGAIVTVGVSNGGGTLACDGGGEACKTGTTGADGTVAFGGLLITGKVAGEEQTLTFTSGALHQDAKVTPTVGDAKNLSVVTAPVAGQLGKALTTQPQLKVTDTWDNAVAGATVTVALTAGGGTLGCFSGSGCDTAPGTGSDGTTTFTSLMITGTVAGTEQTLTFSSTGTTAQTAKVKPSVGDAKNLSIVTAPVAGQLGKALTTQPQLKVTDTWDNPVAGATVTAALTAGGGTLGCFTGSGCTTAPATAADGTTTFSALMITGKIADIQQELTFSSPGTTVQKANVAPTAGDAVSILANAPTNGTYSTPVAPFNQVTPNPQVIVTDAYGNSIGSAGVLWQLAGAAAGATSSSNGAIISAGSTTTTSGLSSVAWTLGDGGNGLTAFLGSVSGPSAAFTASSSTGVTIAACTLSGNTKKTDLAGYSSTLGGYLGYFSILSSGKGMIRSVQVRMSVTGQSSGSGDYPTTLRAYRKNADGTKGALIATFQPNTSDGTLKLPGSNSSPTAVTFSLNPSSTGLATPPEMLIFELQITASSQRTFQVWYNTKPTGPCLTSKLYNPGTVTGTTNFNSTTLQYLAGHALTVTN